MVLKIRKLKISFKRKKRQRKKAEFGNSMAWCLSSKLIVPGENEVDVVHTIKLSLSIIKVRKG